MCGRMYEEGIMNRNLKDGRWWEEALLRPEVGTTNFMPDFGTKHCCFFVCFLLSFLLSYLLPLCALFEIDSTDN